MFSDLLARVFLDMFLLFLLICTLDLFVLDYY
jgi:hypothetical protein